MNKNQLNGQNTQSFISLRAMGRWHVSEILIFVLLIASWFIFYDDHLLLNEIAILAIFAVSLDIILGYAGIISLGHAAFYGVGAYTAILFAQHVYPEPVTGLLVSTFVAGLIGLLTSVLVMRGSDLSRLMITLGVAAIFFEVANKFDQITNGADGLQGAIAPILGIYEFDLYGHTAYAYTLVFLMLVLLYCRKVLRSPFGVGLSAIQNNRLRVVSIGVHVPTRLAWAYTISAAIAGLAGALYSQANAYVSLDVLDFHRSADVLLVLVIGGIGWLYGGVIGAVLFKVLFDILSNYTPQYWMFWLGLILVVLVLTAPQREILMAKIRIFLNKKLSPAVKRSAKGDPNE